VADQERSIELEAEHGILMVMSTDDLRKAALTLPAKDRADLAHELLRSLDGPPDPHADAEWITEIERRARELADGSVQPVDWELARKRIARRLRERRR
jgi:putative addiction module component (TIGR02574 family)